MKVTALFTWPCCWAKFLKVEEGSTKKTGGSLAAKKWPTHIPLRFMDFKAQLACAAVPSPTEELLWKKRHFQGLSDFKRLKFYTCLHLKRIIYTLVENLVTLFLRLLDSKYFFRDTNRNCVTKWLSIWLDFKIKIKLVLHQIFVRLD